MPHGSEQLNTASDAERKLPEFKNPYDDAADAETKTAEKSAALFHTANDCLSTAQHAKEASFKPGDTAEKPTSEATERALAFIQGGRKRSLEVPAPSSEGLTQKYLDQVRYQIWQRLGEEETENHAYHDLIIKTKADGGATFTLGDKTVASFATGSAGEIEFRLSDPKTGATLNETSWAKDSDGKNNRLTRTKDTTEGSVYERTERPDGTGTEHYYALVQDERTPFNVSISYDGLGAVTDVKFKRYNENVRGAVATNTYYVPHKKI